MALTKEEIAEAKSLTARLVYLKEQAQRDAQKEMIDQGRISQIMIRWSNPSSYSGNGITDVFGVGLPSFGSINLTHDQLIMVIDFLKTLNQENVDAEFNETVEVTA